jgi:hypothetical protein
VDRILKPMGNGEYTIIESVNSDKNNTAASKRLVVEKRVVNLVLTNIVVEAALSSISFSRCFGCWAAL